MSITPESLVSSDFSYGVVKPCGSIKHRGTGIRPECLWLAL